MTRPSPSQSVRGTETLFPPLSKGRYRGVSRGMPAEAGNLNPLPTQPANYHATLRTIIPAKAGRHHFVIPAKAGASADGTSIQGWRGGW